MNSKIKDENTDFLFDAILQLQSKEECYQFFEDLCTVSELKALSQRIVVAKMLRRQAGIQRHCGRHRRLHRHH